MAVWTLFSHDWLEKQSKAVPSLSHLLAPQQQKLLQYIKQVLCNQIKMIDLQQKTKKTGFGLVEIVVGTAIVAVGILSLIDGYGLYVKYVLANQENIQAAYLAEEGLESMTFLRDRG